MFDIKALRKSVQDLGAKRQEIRRRIEELQRQREDIATAAPTRADIKAALAAWVTERAAGYESMLHKKLEPVLRRPELLQGTRVSQVMTLLGVTRDPNALPTPQGMDGALCFAFGPQLVEALTRTVDGMSFEEGLPLAQREDQLKKLDDQIEALLAEEQELLSAAQGAGIVIE